jgi:hypothetical protein
MMESKHEIIGHALHSDRYWLLSVHHSTQVAEGGLTSGIGRSSWARTCYLSPFPTSIQRGAST